MTIPTGANMVIQKRLIEGDPHALEKVYKETFSKVYGLCMTYVKDEDQAADLVQETYLKMWRGRKNISLELSLEQQLFVIAKNVVFDHFRKKATEEKLLTVYHSDLHEESEPMYREQQIEEINRLIQKLPLKQRQVIEMAKFQGLTYEEIAKELNISKHTVSSHFSSAMKFLKSNLKLLLLYVLLQ